MATTTVTLSLTDQRLAQDISSQEMILLPLTKYKMLLEKLEDLQDALDLKEAIATSTQMIPWDDVVKEYETQHVQS